jgi:small subunit ribosomal protein S16
VVAALGSYNPHTKESTLDKEKAAFYLEHGAQPSDRVVRLLQAEGVKLPSWVKIAEHKSGKIRNQDKLRRNQPAEEPASEAPAAESTDDASVETEEATEEA